MTRKTLWKSYHAPSENKKNSQGIINEFRPSNAFSFSKVRKSNKRVLAIGNDNTITSIDKSRLVNERKTKQEDKDNQSRDTSIGSTTIDKPLAANTNNISIKNKSIAQESFARTTKDIAVINKQSKSQLPEIKKIDSLNSATASSTIRTIDSITNVLNTQHKNLDVNKNIIANSDTLHQPSNVAKLDIKEKASSQKATDSLSSIKNTANHSSELTHTNDLSTIDSSSWSTDSSLSMKSNGTFNTSTDLLKKEDLISALSKSIDSITSFNDSNSNASLISSSLISDSTLVALDSLTNSTKDSVLADAVTKKEKSTVQLLKRLSFDLVGTILSTGAVTKSTGTLHKTSVDNKNQKDKSGLGYVAGIIANYKMNERFSVSTGIVYTVFEEQYNFNYNLKKIEMVYVDSSWQQVEVDSINRASKTKDKYSFISIPLQVSYTFIKREKISFAGTAGIRTNILWSGVTHIANQNQSDVIELKSGFNTISFSYLLELEAAYKLNEHTALLLQPTFVYAATSIHNKASALSQKPYGIGVAVGMRVTF